jgi:hypothetical protein
MTGDEPVGDWQGEHLRTTFPEYLIACKDGMWTAQRKDGPAAEPITQPSGRLLQVAILNDIAQRAHRSIRGGNGASLDMHTSRQHGKD